MKNPRWLVLISALAGLGACKEEQVSVHVNCATTWAPAVVCDVAQTVGKREVEACWDFVVTCANGNRVTAERTCQSIKDGNSVKTVIPAAKLTGYDRCAGDGPQISKLSGLTLDGTRTD